MYIRKILYFRKRGGTYSVLCYGYCNECAVRFKCYTTRDKGLHVTLEESLLCKEKDGGVIPL